MTSQCPIPEFGYLDTSIVVPYYCPEVFTSLSQGAIAAIERPVISRLVEVEFASALSLKVRTAQIDVATAQASYGRFQTHLTDGYYSVVEMQDSVFQLARDWVERFDLPLRTLDALHLASAHLFPCELITADKNLAKSAVVLGLKCRLIG